MQKNKLNKKAQLEHVSIVILSLIVLTSGVLLANNSTINNSFIQPNNISENIIEKIAEIEIYANTSLTLEIINNNISAFLTLDNETVLPEQEIEFYLNEDLIYSSITNSQGYAYSNLYNTSPGTYSFKAAFQGNPSLYLNPSSTENIIQIIEQNGTKEIMFIEQNLTESNITIEKNITVSNQTLFTINTDKKIYIQNETINIFGQLIIEGERVDKEIKLEIEFNESQIFTTNISSLEGNYEYSLIADFQHEGEYLVNVLSENLSAQTSFYFLKTLELENLEGFTCKEFEDNLLWSSGFTHSQKGSIKYQTWTPEIDCTEAGGQNCFLQDISIASRTIYISSNDKEINGKSYIQISNPDNSICDNPEKGVYSTYLAYESIKGIEGQKKGWYYGHNKEESEDLKSKPKNGIKLNSKFTSDVECYGIKAYAPKSTIIDVFKVRYKWCWDKSYGDNSEYFNKKIRGRKNG